MKQHSQVVLGTKLTVSKFIGVFGTELQSTSPNAAYQSPKFPAANSSVRPAVKNWTFRGFVAAHLAPADFLSRRSDGLELIRCVIRLSSLNVLGRIWKRISVWHQRNERIRVSPFHGIALYKSTFTYFTLLYLLTYLQTLTLQLTLDCWWHIFKRVFFLLELHNRFPFSSPNAYWCVWSWKSENLLTHL